MAIRVAGLNPVRDRAEVTRPLGVQLQESGLQPKLLESEALELYSHFYRKSAPWQPLTREVIGPGGEGQRDREIAAHPLARQA